MFFVNFVPILKHPPTPGLVSMVYIGLTMVHLWSIYGTFMVHLVHLWQRCTILIISLTWFPGVTKSKRRQWHTKEAYFKAKVLGALLKLRRVWGGADFEGVFFKEVGHDRVYCFRLVPKVWLPRVQKKDCASLIYGPSMGYIFSIYG